MANPFVLIARNKLYLDNGRIDVIMQALYDPAFGIDEDGQMIATVGAIPTKDTIEEI